MSQALAEQDPMPLSKTGGTIGEQVTGLKFSYIESLLSQNLRCRTHLVYILPSRNVHVSNAQQVQHIATSHPFKAQSYI